MDSNSVYWPETLPLPLVNPQITTDPRNERTQFETNRVRTRRLAEDLWEVFEFQWNFVQDQFDAFKTFFEEELENGSLPFVIDIFGVPTEVAFLEPSYTINRTDNLFAVTGKFCTV